MRRERKRQKHSSHKPTHQRGLIGLIEFQEIDESNKLIAPSSALLRAATFTNELTRNGVHMHGCTTGYSVAFTNVRFLTHLNRIEFRKTICVKFKMTWKLRAIVLSRSCARHKWLAQNFGYQMNQQKQFSKPRTFCLDGSPG